MSDPFRDEHFPETYAAERKRVTGDDRRGKEFRESSRCAVRMKGYAGRKRRSQEPETQEHRASTAGFRNEPRDEREAGEHERSGHVPYGPKHERFA